MDGVIQVSNKVGHAVNRGLPGELKADQTLKEAHKTYSRLKLPGYGDGVPVQECLNEPRWSAYRDGLWGRRLNPLTPTGDVRPGADRGVPMGERLVAPTAAIPPDDVRSSSADSLSRWGSSLSDSSPGPRQRVHRLTCRVISSDLDEASDHTDGGVNSTIAPEFPALQVPSDDSLTQAVTASVFHRSQMETDEAATSRHRPLLFEPAGPGIGCLVCSREGCRQQQVLAGLRQGPLTAGPLSFGRSPLLNPIR